MASEAIVQAARTFGQEPCQMCADLAAQGGDEIWVMPFGAYRQRGGEDHRGFVRERSRWTKIQRPQNLLLELRLGSHVHDVAIFAYATVFSADMKNGWASNPFQIMGFDVQSGLHDGGVSCWNRSLN
ncbi:MAG: hypothetical protein ACYCSP_13475 [Acidobacteriaceae bacterium]